jgi:hypothetical protein
MDDTVRKELELLILTREEDYRELSNKKIKQVNNQLNMRMDVLIESDSWYFNYFFMFARAFSTRHMKAPSASRMSALQHLQGCPVCASSQLRHHPCGANFTPLGLSSNFPTTTP